jgi:hypothetical protein
MSSADASEAGRLLARARWGDSALRSAIATLSERRDELTEPLRDQLRQIADPDGEANG